MKKTKITEMERLTPAEFKAKDKIPVVIVLDNVRSLHNVGSIFRTCDAFLFEAIYLCGITATPPNAEIHKTALGAENTVEWSYFDSTHEAVKQLKRAGFKIYAVEQAHGSTLLTKLTIDTAEKYALVLGNEVKGVQQSIVDQCDACIEIPQYGTKHSLNVSISGGIVIWEFFKHFAK